jgi:hypothetical protein
MYRKALLFASGFVVTLATTSVSADTVRLVNGDTIHGQVVSVDQKEVKLQSTLLGVLTIARNRVEVIAFGNAVLEVPAAAQKSQGTAAANATGNPVADSLQSKGIDPKALALPAGSPGNLTPPGAGGEPTKGGVADAVRQLQTQGLDPALAKQLQQALPMFGSPEVQKYFNETLSGLAAGQIDVPDLRKQAISVRAQLQDLEKDLGPGAKAALAPYAAVLDQFIRETDPPQQAPRKAQPTTPPATDVRPAPPQSRR